jgi:16S rRNA (uracil1498-N3)-methyltransferase
MKQEKLHWFLIDSADLKVVNNLISLTIIQLLHQFNRVLKFKQGEKVVLFTGVGTWYKCEIENLQKRECTLKILEKNVKQRSENKIINLYFGIPKKNKFEMILEKGTEVGVSSFNPIITDRTEKLNIKKERAERILIEASEQSQNPILPLLEDVKKIEDVIQKLNPKNTFVFHTSGENLDQSDLKFFGETNLLIGPEGGWSIDEITNFKNRNFKIYKIGESVLKTETACIVIPFLFSTN